MVTKVAAVRTAAIFIPADYEWNVLRMGYIRIEAEAGGAGRMDIPASNAGLIDKGPDARAKKSFERSEIRVMART